MTRTYYPLDGIQHTYTSATTTTEPQTTASPIPGPPVPPRPRVVNRPDISVRLAAPRQAAAGSVQVVTVTVSNVGTALAAASSTSLSFSGGLTLVDAGGGTATDGGAEFATPALRPGKDVVFQVKIRADRAGTEVLYVVDPPQPNERNAANNFAVTFARIR